MCAKFAAKRSRVYVVDEGALTVDLDHGQPLTIRRFQLRVPTDVDLLEVERKLAAHLLEDRAGTLAEVTALRVVQPDLSYG